MVTHVEYSGRKLFAEELRKAAQLIGVHSTLFYSFSEWGHLIDRLNNEELRKHFVMVDLYCFHDQMQFIEEYEDFLRAYANSLAKKNGHSLLMVIRSSTDQPIPVAIGFGALVDLMVTFPIGATELHMILDRAIGKV